jgi:hypothetical protein
MRITVTAFGHFLLIFVITSFGILMAAQQAINLTHTNDSFYQHYCRCDTSP